MFFFFNDTATTEIYTLSLHDALPISSPTRRGQSSYRRRRESGARPSWRDSAKRYRRRQRRPPYRRRCRRSEEHTSELQSPCNLVCRLLLEKKRDISDKNQEAFRPCAY